MIKITVVCWQSVSSPQSGYAIRTRGLWDSLKATYVSPPPTLEGHIKIAPSILSKIIPGPMNPQIFSFFKNSGFKNLNLGDSKPDLLIAEGLWSVNWTSKLAKHLNIPFLVDIQNIEWIAAETWPGWIRNRLQIYENKAYQKASGWITPTEHDKTFLIENMQFEGSKIFLAPNGVDIKKFEGVKGKSLRQKWKIKPEETVLLFLGKLDYPPNKDAVIWLNQITQNLKKRFQGIRVIVAGRNSDSVKSYFKEESPLEFVGEVESAEEAICAADICLAPLRMGSGSRIKILEYLAAGKPVITTQKGMEGLDLSPNEDVLVAETPQGWEMAVEMLLNNPEFARKVAVKGNKTVEEKYQWGAIASKLELELKSFV